MVAFQVLNHGSTLFEDQAEIDALDWKIVTDGIYGRGVFSGGDVSAQTTPDGSAVVSAGIARFGGDPDVPFSAGSVSVISGSANADGSVGVAAGAKNPRYDLIIVNSSGQLGVVHGDTPPEANFDGGYYVNPVFPAWASNQVVLASVYVIPQSSSQYTGTIITGIRTPKGIRLNKNAFLQQLHALTDAAYHSGEMSNAQHGIRSVASAHDLSHLTGVLSVAQGRPPIPQQVLLAGVGTWTDQPAGVTELFGSTLNRHQFDFTGVTQARFKVRVNAAGFSGAVLFPQYSTDDSTYAELAATANGLNISLTTTGTKRTAWANIATGAKIDPSYIRVVGRDGNSTVDPVFGLIELEVK